jgi:hypothetical protein
VETVFFAQTLASTDESARRKTQNIII